MMEIDKADIYFLVPLGTSEDDVTTALLNVDAPNENVVLLGGYAVMQAALTLPESDCFIALSGINNIRLRSVCCVLTSATKQELIKLTEKARRLVDPFAVQAIGEIE